MFRKCLLSATIASAIVLPTTALATNGMIPLGFGAKAKGMAGVGIAMPQEATAAANNPAGMVHLGNRVDFGLEFFVAERNGEIEGNNHPMLPPGMGNFSRDADNDGMAFIPEGGFNYMINDRMAVGVSMVGVGGMNTHYDQLMMFNGRAFPNNTGINLEQLKLIPTLSYKFNDRHSVGVGLVFGYQQFKAYGLDAFTGTGMPPACFGDGSCAASSHPSRLTDHGVDGASGFGFNIGWQGQITDQLTIGAAYHSKVDMSEFDEYKGLFVDEGDLDIPAWFGLGLSYKVTPKLTVAFDYTRTLYSGVDAISQPLQAGAPPGFPSGANMFMPNSVLGTSEGSGFGWEDVDVFKLGITYQVNDAWILRAGWNHGDTPIKSDQTFFNLLAPATIKDHITLGSTWTLANDSELTMYVYHAIKNEVKGKNSIPAAFGGGEANVEMSQMGIGIAYGWNF